MENNENKKPSAENAGAKKPNHKKHHHSRKGHHKPKTAEGAVEVKKTAEVDAAESTPKTDAQNNKNKNSNSQPKAHPEAEIKATEQKEQSAPALSI